MEIMRDSLQEQIDDLRRQLSANLIPVYFTMAELESRMRAANAWPVSEEDRNLSPGTLWQKYQPKAP